MEPLELPEVDFEEVMRKSQFHRHEGSRPFQGWTNRGLEESQEDKVQLWNEMKPLELPEVDVEEVMSKSLFHWHEGSRPDSRETNLELDKIWEDKIQLMEDALELGERKVWEIKQMDQKIKRSCWAIMLCPVILVVYRWLL